MPSPKCFNIDELLKPCTNGGPAGFDLRLDTAHDAIYQQLRSAYSNSKSIEKKLQERATGADGQPLYTPEQLEWRKVKDLALKALRDHSKDYQIAAWLCEALVRVDSAAGLRDGIRFARRLGDDFWSGIHPMPEVEEGIEPPSPIEKITTRVQAFVGLLTGMVDTSKGTFEGPLVMAILGMPLTEGDRYSFLELRQIKKSGKATRQVGASTQDVTIGEVQAAIDATPAEFYQNLFDDIDKCLAELDEFGKFLDQRCGKDEKGFPISPSTAEVQKTLETCREMVREIGKAKGLFADAPVEAEAGGALQVADGAPGQNGRRPFTREDALAQLLMLAEFFRRSEPHSPVSHHVEEAVRWGRMGLGELLGELIGDDKARQQVLQRIGIIDVPEGKKKQ
jgi:type VI secretion system protein ImpA